MSDPPPQPAASRAMAARATPTVIHRRVWWSVIIVELLSSAFAPVMTRTPFHLL
jgi:hypothetical protein